MTDAFRQLSLFYHLGVRESFSMANNIILYCDTNADSLQSLQVSGGGGLSFGRLHKIQIIDIIPECLFFPLSGDNWAEKHCKYTALLCVFPFRTFLAQCSHLVRKEYAF